MERVRVPHGLRDAAGGFDVDERSFADSWTLLRRFQPFAFVIHQFRPVRKGLALQWLRGVNGTAIRLQKGTLRVARNPQTAQVFRPVDISLLEHSRLDAQIRGEAHDIVFGQVDETLLFATFYAAGLALKSQASQV